MSAPPYMKLYVGDYVADTMSLTTREHGAYMLLLMSMWRAGGKLPVNDAKFAQITKTTPREWAEIRDPSRYSSTGDFRMPTGDR